MISGSSTTAALVAASVLREANREPVEQHDKLIDRQVTANHSEVDNIYSEYLQSCSGEWIECVI